MACKVHGLGHSKRIRVMMALLQRETRTQMFKSYLQLFCLISLLSPLVSLIAEARETDLPETRHSTCWVKDVQNNFYWGSGITGKGAADQALSDCTDKSPSPLTCKPVECQIDP